MTNLIATDNYTYVDWKTKFTNKVDLSTIKYDKSWEDLFQRHKEKKYFKEIENYLTGKLNKNIFPYPDLLFNCFQITPLENVKVVIIGQDPYFNAEKHNGKIIPEAMGLSFSVPVGIKIPSSLKNVYANLLKFKHIDQIPQHGNLTSWANQGCLLYNCASTVEQKDANSHQKIWEDFADKTIRYLNKNKDDLVFILWGSFASKKAKYIEEDKHKIIICSHPSGLSCSNKLGDHSCFKDCDWANEANLFLKNHNKEPIVWKI